MGLDPRRDVKIIHTGRENGSDRLKLLAKGEIDATVAEVDALPELGEEIIKVHKLAEFSDFRIRLSGATIAVARDFLERQRDTLWRFARALQESLALTRIRPDLVRRTYQRHLKLEDPMALDRIVREYMDRGLPTRPLPDRQTILTHIEELSLKHPKIPRNLGAYIDESLF